MAKPIKTNGTRAVQALQYDGTNGQDIIDWVTQFLAANSAYTAQALASSTERGGVLTFAWTSGMPGTMVVNTTDFVVLDVLTFRVYDALSFGFAFRQIA